MVCSARFQDKRPRSSSAAEMTADVEPRLDYPSHAKLQKILSDALDRFHTAAALQILFTQLLAPERAYQSASTSSHA